MLIEGVAMRPRTGLLSGECGRFIVPRAGWPVSRDGFAGVGRVGRVGRVGATRPGATAAA